MLEIVMLAVVVEGSHGKVVNCVVSYGRLGKVGMIVESRVWFFIV